MMSAEQIKTTFKPAMDEIIERCSVSEAYVDKEQFQIMLATIWGNAVLDPSRSGISEDQLPELHDFLNTYLVEIVGAESNLTNCFEFIVSKAGQDSMDRQRITPNHRQFLHHFARLILQRIILPET
ncbi:hypothetical protein OA067_01015 [Gammaproteobacteria bacterium]|nr:hypothetical protein [Gammaproteobacteria bacterium]